jgi:DNA-binding YbaB/EbfC family protein
MFGNIGQLMNIMKNAGQIKESMKVMNERLQAARFTGEAGGGQVQATVDGRGEMISIRIEPALVQGGDVELLEDLTCAAVRDAVNRSRTAIQKEMQDITGGLNLPGMDKLFG